MNIDVSCIVDGYYGDCSRMVAIGKISQEKQHLIDVTRECLRRSIEIVKPDVLVSKIGDVVTDYAESEGCSVVYQFVGHGVGLQFHEAPQVLHSRNTTHIPLAPGMIFTIEPMINAGTAETVLDTQNQWEARTTDGLPSAQEEHTVLVTETGHEILTL